ncbi:MAG: 4Fe-4S dicluster domain-containing protein [Nitrososphaeria archaeon]
MERFLKIDKGNVNTFLNRIMKYYQLIGPVKTDKGVSFEYVSDDREIELDYVGHTILPPKKFFFPPIEEMFVYEYDETGNMRIHDFLEEVSKGNRVIFGVKPCDVSSLLILDKVFTGEYNDPYYTTRRNNTLVIGMTCNRPMEYCFCAYVNSGPSIKKGFDLLLSDLGDTYLVEVGGEKGWKLTKFNLDIFNEAGKEDVEERDRILLNVEEEIRRKILPNFATVDRILIERFSDEIWEDYGRKCLACGKCNFTCPTCRCFTISDEPNPDLKSGKRVRTWDSCHFLSFTKVASGEVFRRDRPSRFKQRIYHKFVYSINEIGSISCVGCGRCIEVCPAKINIFDVVKEVIVGDKSLPAKAS